MGIIPLGAQHQRRVEAALEKALLSERADPRDCFALDRHEGVFIKTLELVQGVERDIPTAVEGRGMKRGKKQSAVSRRPRRRSVGNLGATGPFRQEGTAAR